MKKYKYTIKGNHPTLRYITRQTNSMAEKDRIIAELKENGYEIKIEVDIKWDRDDNMSSGQNVNSPV